MSDTAQGPGWWQASDGKWYPPQNVPPPPFQESGYQPPHPGASGFTVPYGGAAGRLGKRENIGTQILLSIVTLGLYGVYWAYKSHEEIKEHSGEGVGGVVGVVIYIFAGFVTWFLLPIEIEKMYRRDGRESPVKAATAFWILLFAIPWYVKCQNALNDYWEGKGVPAP